MEVNFCEERIVELQAAFSADQVHERALARRVEAFGQVARLFQRPKPEDIEIVAIQRRLEPFWHVMATAHYTYERQHVYRVEVPAEVRAVTIGQEKYEVSGDKDRYFDVPSLDHCHEESRRELLVDAISGRETDLKKYLVFGKSDVPDLESLRAGDVVVLPPQTRSSLLARKIIGLLVRTFEADEILEDRIDFDELTLYYRPVDAIEYLWEAKQKRQVVELDALTGDTRAEGGRFVQQARQVLENDTLFDIGADTIGTIMPGANIAVKVGRFAARKVIR
jgi:hypothetical protein